MAALAATIRAVLVFLPVDSLVPGLCAAVFAAHEVIVPGIYTAGL